MVIFSGGSLCAVIGGVVGRFMVEILGKSASMSSDTSTVDCVIRCDLRMVRGSPMVVFSVVLLGAAVGLVGFIVGSNIGKSSAVSCFASAVDCTGGCAW